MDTLLPMKRGGVSSSDAGLSCLSVFGAVEGGCGRLEFGVGLVCLLQNLLSFIARQALLSGKLEGLETRMGGACLHLFLAN